MLQLLIFLALQGFSLAVPSLTPVSKPKPYFDWDSTKYLIAFGDSYTYVQGTLGFPGYSFIGSYLPDQYAITPEELLSDQIVQNFTGTAEGGPNWVEFLTGCGHRPGLTSPQDCKVQLWDFAFAGADVAEEYTPLHHNFTTPLINQTQQFLTYVQPYFERKKIHQQSQALVAIWIGINDISDSSKYNVSFPNFYNDIISTLFEESVEPLYRAGYHNFLFLNLPPLDRTPSNIGNAHPLPNKTMVDWWDNTLLRHSTAFSAVHANVKSMVFDANTFLNGVLDNPEHYGITNITSFCPGYTDPIIITDPGKYGCSSIDQYFWFNPGHMTSHTHSLLAPEIEQFLEGERTL